MPSLELSIIKNILDKSKNIILPELNIEYPIFIETGTYMGSTINKMKYIFDELYTIEIDEKLYNNAKNKYKDTNKIKFYLGDSGKILNNIISIINNNAIFFLDGHYSSGITGKGDKDVPLYEELNSIITQFNYYSIIIIDDVRLFGKGPNNKDNYQNENWEDININEILKIVKPKLLSHYYLPSKLHKQDRLILHLHS